MNTHKNERKRSDLQQTSKETDGERQIAILLVNIGCGGASRRVRPNGTSYLAADDDGWIIEVMHCAKVNRSMLQRRWEQAAIETNRMHKENPASKYPKVPVLFYKQARAGWRAVWPLHLAAAQQRGSTSACYSDTVEGSPDAWSQVVRLGLSQLTCPGSKWLREELTNRYYHYYDYDYDPDDPDDPDDPR